MTIKNLYPTIKPSLDLNFARSKTLDPRVSFSRASVSGIGAAYYDGKTVAKAEENLLTYSQEFDNAAWVKASVTVVANADIAPDGTLTADYLSPTSADSNIQRDFTPAGALPYVFTVWLKSATGANVSTQLVCNRTSPYSVVQTQAITVTTSWQRFTLSFSALDASLHNLAVGRASTLETGENLLIWGAQLEQRSSATAYTPTTTAPITNYLPALQYAAAGVPRFDHDPITGESKGLLIEESRTNLLTYSSEFDNAAWTKANATVTVNAAVAPDGTLTADKLVENTATSTHQAYQNYTPTQLSNVVFSVYAKAAERSVVTLLEPTGVERTFNLGTGVATGSGASMVSAGDGWWRCIASGALIDTATRSYALRLNNGSSVTYTGDGTSGIYIWGAQLEAGAFPTSYIPTTSAQVTRAADSASMTGANFSSWYRQDEGAVLAEVNVPFALSYTSRLLTIDDGTSNNILQCQYNGSAQMTFALDVAGSNRFAVSKSGMTFGSTHKLAGAYQTGNSIFGSDGANASGSAATVAGFAPTTLRIGSAPGATLQPNGYIKRIAYYPKRLTDAQLQALTV